MTKHKWGYFIVIGEINQRKSKNNKHKELGTTLVGHKLNNYLKPHWNETNDISYIWVDVFKFHGPPYGGFQGVPMRKGDTLRDMPGNGIGIFKVHSPQSILKLF